MRINFMKRMFLLFITVFFPVASALADSKTVIEYFADNLLIKLIVSGGYYSLAAIVILAIICKFHDKSRYIVLSVTLAIFGLLLVLFTFESLSSIKLMP